MKKLILSVFVLFLLLGTNVFAQREHSYEDHGGTLNLGIGLGGYLGYYGYVGSILPVFHINYEFEVANNLTIAPFATLYTFRGDHYRETIIPIGLKGTFYFDQLLHLRSDWDFYLAGSAGFAVVTSVWDNGYSKEASWINPGALFLDLHIGVEYHLTSQLGIFLDLSNGVSTAGLAIH